jgi:hypothetical protein
MYVSKEMNTVIMKPFSPQTKKPRYD